MRLQIHVLLWILLTYSTERALREKVWKTYYSRGDNGDKYDNNENVAKILKLRKRRVSLLGYNNAD